MSIYHESDEDDDEPKLTADQLRQPVSQLEFRLTMRAVTAKFKAFDEAYSWVNDIRKWALLALLGGGATAVWKLIAK